MADEFEATRHPRGSPWPIFVALGLAMSEVGVFLGVRSVSVGGLLLFVGSIAGILHESGFIVRRERAVSAQGVVLVGIGLALIAVNHTGSMVRGQSIAIAGVICVLAVFLWLAYTRT